MASKIEAKGYGKNFVRVMWLKRQGDVHSISELSVNVELELLTTVDYEKGDNKDVVATDSQKNTILVLAKKHGIHTPEEFALLLVAHFLKTYPQVVRCQVYAQQSPWQRISTGGVPHSHAFINAGDTVRFCSVAQERGASPILSGGLKGMKLLKTTQSGFEGFHRDAYTTLPEVRDRSFCTSVYCKYTFTNVPIGANFNGIWESVRTSILNEFAGHPQKGTYSPSVQKTLFDTGNLILGKNPLLKKVELHMPNIHYFTADLTKLGYSKNNEVFIPSDAPQGNIWIIVARTAAKL